MDTNCIHIFEAGTKKNLRFSHLYSLSPISNKRTGWNKRILREEFFLLLHEKKGFYYIEINEQWEQKLKNQ